MSSESKLQFVRRLAPLFLLSLTLIFGGCGKKDANDATSPGRPVSVDYVEPDVPPTLPEGASMGAVVPTTLSVLQFMPANAQVALGIPPVPGAVADAVALARVAEPAEEVDEDFAELFREIGQEFGVEASSYDELALALGLDKESPIGLFADFTELAQSAAMPGEAGLAAPPLNPEDDGLERAKSYFDQAEQPHWIAVVRVADPGKAIAAVEREAAKHDRLANGKPGTEEANGIAITTLGEFGYFTYGPFFAFGSLDLLRGAAARTAEPAKLRYGTTECPASEADEIAMLVYGGRFLPIMEEVLPVLGIENGGAMMAATAQMAMYEKMFTADDNDPIVITLARGDDEIEMLWRVDTATHPGILEVTGPAEPLRLARLLPEDTLGLFSFRFNEQFKQQLMNDVAPALSASGDQDMAMQVAMGTQFISQLGDEATIAVAAGQGGMPDIFVLLGLAQPEATKGVLEAFVPMEPMEGSSGAPINKVSTPWLPVYLSFQDDFAVLGSSEEGTRRLLDRVAAGTDGGYFAKLDPPYDVEVPRYQAVLIQSSIVTAIANATAMFTGSSPDPAEFAPFTTAIRALRTDKSLRDSWLTGRITLYLGDLEEAARLKAQQEALSAETEGAATL